MTHREIEELFYSLLRMGMSAREAHHFFIHIVYRRSRAPRGHGENSAASPSPGAENAVRPPWAPPEPPPLQIAPPMLPGLVDLAEQAQLVFEVRRCPGCGVSFHPWAAQPGTQYVNELVTITGCSCKEPRVYTLNGARRLGLL